MDERAHRHREVRFCKWSCRFSRNRVFFISYPKSGRTWVRFLVDDYRCRLAGREFKHVFKVERKLRLRHHIEWTHLGGSMAVPLYAMEPPDISLLQKTPCVFLLRNFYSILASAFYHAAYREKIVDVDTEQFLWGMRHGVMHMISFFNLWINLTERIPPVTYVSYEGLKRNTRSEFEAILRALGLPIHDELVTHTLAAGSLDNMKRLASSEAYRGTVLAPAEAGDTRSAKVRSGSSEGYRGVFSKEQVDLIATMIDRFFIGKDDPRYAACICRDGAPSSGASSEFAQGNSSNNE